MIRQGESGICQEEACTEHTHTDSIQVGAKFQQYDERHEPEIDFANDFQLDLLRDWHLQFHGLHPIAHCGIDTDGDKNKSASGLASEP